MVVSERVQTSLSTQKGESLDSQSHQKCCYRFIMWYRPHAGAAHFWRELCPVSNTPSPSSRKLALKISSPLNRLRSLCIWYIYLERMFLVLNTHCYTTVLSTFLPLVLSTASSSFSPVVTVCHTVMYCFPRSNERGRRHFVLWIVWFWKQTTGHGSYGQ